MSESKLALARRVAELEEQLEAARNFRGVIDASGALIIAASSFGAGFLSMMIFDAIKVAI